jgi:uncharacterized protein YjiS (DUF1127 family)
MTSRTSIGGLRAAWRIWRTSRRTVDALSKLTAHELKDIGLSHDDAAPFHPWKFPQH